MWSGGRRPTFRVGGQTLPPCCVQRCVLSLPLQKCCVGGLSDGLSSVVVLSFLLPRAFSFAACAVHGVVMSHPMQHLVADRA